MSDPTCIYLSLSFEDYKDMEFECKLFEETIHKSTGGFYHKSFRLRLNEHLTLEFHGPLVKAAESQELSEAPVG